MLPFIEINERRVGSGYPTYIIAELSANHNHSFEHAVRLVKLAKRSGADAVKVQTYTADTLTLNSSNSSFTVDGGTPWDGLSLYQLYQDAAMPWEWQPKLKKVANQIGLDFFSSAFDNSAVTFLEKMAVPAYKLASPEIVDTLLIKEIAKTGKPLLISTGMASLEEIREAINTAKSAGAQEIILLKCTSAYPSPLKDMNLLTMPDLSKVFNVPVGLSDHTLGFTTAIASVALGACVVEKHLTTTRRIKGPDSSFSMEPTEFKEMVESIRHVEACLGEVHYGPTEGETASLKFRRSLFVVEDMHKGDFFTETNVKSFRPAIGLAPKYYDRIIGRRASKDIAKNSPLQWDSVE